MADPLPRYQIGDTCYSGIEATANAWVAAMPAHFTQMDHGAGAGVEQTVVTASFNSDAGDHAMLDYWFEGLISGGMTQRQMGYYPTPCQLDEVHAERNADLITMWPVVLLVLVGVWGARKLMDIFTTNRQDA